MTPTQTSEGFQQPSIGQPDAKLIVGKKNLANDQDLSQFVQFHLQQTPVEIKSYHLLINFLDLETNFIS